MQDIPIELAHGNCCQLVRYLLFVRDVNFNCIYPHYHTLSHCDWFAHELTNTTVDLKGPLISELAFVTLSKVEMCGVRWCDKYLCKKRRCEVVWCLFMQE